MRRFLVTAAAAAMTVPMLSAGWAEPARAAERKKCDAPVSFSLVLAVQPGALGKATDRHARLSFRGRPARRVVVAHQESYLAGSSAARRYFAKRVTVCVLHRARNGRVSLSATSLAGLRSQVDNGRGSEMWGLALNRKSRITRIHQIYTP